LRKKMEGMTPEQRQEFMKKMREEREKAAPPKADAPKTDAPKAEAKKPEAAKVEAAKPADAPRKGEGDREAFRKSLEGMTPEERKEAIRKRLESMTPEEREAFKKRRAERQGGGTE